MGYRVRVLPVPPGAGRAGAAGHGPSRLLGVVACPPHTPSGRCHSAIGSRRPGAVLLGHADLGRRKGGNTVAMPASSWRIVLLYVRRGQPLTYGQLAGPGSRAEPAHVGEPTCCQPD